MRRFRRRPVASAASPDLAARARRLHRRGDERKALVTLRLACCDDNRNPKLWVQYGHYAWLGGKLSEAREAFTQAVWLFERRQQQKRADTVRDYATRVLADAA
jgi:hypothetical protein